MSRVSSPVVRFTVEQLFQLVEMDVLGTNRVELINGRIYRMPAQALPHLVAVSRGNRLLNRVASSAEWLVCQGTIRLGKYSAPDPDFIWLPCPEGTSVDRWPQPILLIEISDSTYRKDSGIKLRTYAFHGVPEYWIENLKEDRIEVYRQPENPTGKLVDCRYALVQHFTRGQSIPIAARPGITLSVDELLP
jgi:Uma2 family endonuclease